MSVRQALNTAVMTLALSLAVGAAAPVADAQAQQGTGAAKAGNPSTIRQALEQQVGKHAKLKLLSGQDVEGKVAEVSTEVVIINELTGMEFFGATVRLDQVAAVIVRTSSQ